MEAESSMRLLSKSFACAFYFLFFFLVWLCHANREENWMCRNEMATFHVAPKSRRKIKFSIVFLWRWDEYFVFAWSIPSQSNLFNDILQYFFLARNAWTNRTKHRRTFWFTKNIPLNSIQQMPHFFLSILAT